MPAAPGPRRSPKPCCACRRPTLGASQISQIVVRRLFDTDNVYVFQNSDRRLIFASPYRARFHADRHRNARRSRAIPPWCRWPPPMSPISATRPTVIFASGSIRRMWSGRFPAPTPVDGSRQPARRAGWLDGVRPPARQGAAADDVRRRHHDRAAARGAGGLEADAVLSDVAALDRARRTARRRFCLGRGSTPRSMRARERWRFLDEAQARRLVAAYGSRLAAVLGDAKDRADLGPAFGPELTGGGGALSDGKGMGAFSRRHSLAALQTRSDHAARGSRRAGGVHGDGEPNWPPAVEPTPIRR